MGSPAHWWTSASSAGTRPDPVWLGLGAGVGVGAAGFAYYTGARQLGQARTWDAEADALHPPLPR